jgi:hypothetical protein
VAEGREGDRRQRRWLGGLAGLAGLAAGTIGVSLWLMRGRSRRDGDLRGREGDRWARPGMGVTFRAELMPGRSRTERTYRVAELLPNDRVTLEGVAGEHSETEFEARR